MKYKNKRSPYRLEPDPQHWTRKSAHRWKEKMAFESEEEASEYLELHPKDKEFGMQCFLCSICGKWHLGHSANLKK